jgi:hypothetical protein
LTAVMIVRPTRRVWGPSTDQLQVWLKGASMDQPLVNTRYCNRIAYPKAFDWIITASKLWGRQFVDQIIKSIVLTM